ncbi:MAG TPA: Na+/H+ antiporter subunit E [Beijerinckiaceae bacterium]|jgi:multicomponent K+:H+ antiporter subunit E
MRRIVPYPVLSVFLFCAWLLLWGASVGSALLGLLLALGLAHLLTPLLDAGDAGARTGRPTVGALASFGWTVLVEIVRSNIAVAKIILGPRRSDRRSGFVRIPLDMRSSRGLTALAIIITSTPGTIWVEYRSQDNSILLHVLDLIDEQEWVRIIKDKYERHLMEMFG